MRICSFIPSATEIVYALGLGEELFGVTYHCDFPPAAKKKPVVVHSALQGTPLDSAAINARVVQAISGGKELYTIDADALRQAKPDLVLIQQLCEVCACPARQVAEAISGLETRPEVLSLDPNTLDDVLQDILKVGQATNKEDKAQEFVSVLSARIEAVKSRAALVQAKPRVLCLEWLEPLMCGGHWVPHMVQLVGGLPLISKVGEPSFKITWQQVHDEDPDVLAVMPCGFNVSQCLKELGWLTRREGWGGLKAVKSNRVFLTDAGSYFSRSGPRLVEGLEILAEIIHPELFSNQVPEGAALRLYGPLVRMG